MLRVAFGGGLQCGLRFDDSGVAYLGWRAGRLGTIGVGLGMGTVTCSVGGLGPASTA